MNKTASKLEIDFANQLLRHDIDPPVVEYAFALPRKWRLDFAWPERLIAVEVEGGSYSGGRHTTGKGFAADCEKYNTAAFLGWYVFRLTGKMIGDVHFMRNFAELMDKVRSRDLPNLERVVVGGK